MTDVARIRAELVGLFPDNTSRDISPQDLRDFVQSVDLSAEGAKRLQFGDASSATFPSTRGEAGQVLQTNADGTTSWEDVAGGGGGLTAGQVQSNLETHAGLTTTAHGGLVASNDSRLTNSRTPTAHANSHGLGQADAVSAASIGAALSGHSHSGTYEPVLGNPSASGYVLSSTDTGTRSWLAVGTSANNLVKLDGSAKLPAVDGSQLTNIGVNAFQSRTSDPGTLADGMIWFRSDLYEFRVRANGTTWRLTVSPVT